MKGRREKERREEERKKKRSSRRKEKQRYEYVRNFGIDFCMDTCLKVWNTSFCVESLFGM